VRPAARRKARFFLPGRRSRGKCGPARPRPAAHAGCRLPVRSSTLSFCSGRSRECF